VADAIHSLCDVAISIVLVGSLYISGKEADEDHPFGHGKMEFVGTGIIGLSMLMVAILIVWYSIKHMMTGDLEVPERIAMLVAIISIAGNYLLYQHSLCAGREANSSVIVANAYENWADAISSIAVLIGILGAQFGWVFLDPLAAVFVGALIFGAAVRTLRETAMGLADCGPWPDTTKEIRTAVERIDGVIEVDSIKGRRVGRDFEVGVRVKVESTNTVEWSNEVAQRIRGAVRRIVENAGRVEVGFQGV